MKKVKVTVNEGSLGRTLPVFPDPESAYVWLTSESLLDDIADVDKVALLPGEFIEAEWRGCEYCYDGPNHVKLDLVRFAKASQPANSSGLVVSIHYGWVASCIIPFHAFKDEDIEVKLLPVEEQRIDLTVLFKDHEDKK